MSQSFDILRSLKDSTTKTESSDSKVLTKSNIRYIEHYSIPITEDTEGIHLLTWKVNHVNDQALNQDEISELLKAYYKPHFKKQDYKYVLVYENSNPSFFEYERFDQKKQIVIYNKGHLKKYPNGTLLVFEKKTKHPFWDYLFEYLEPVWRHIIRYIKYRHPYVKTEDEISEVEAAMLAELKFQRSYKCVEFCVQNKVTCFELPSNKIYELLPLKLNKDYKQIDEVYLNPANQYSEADRIFINFKHCEDKNYGICIPRDWLVVEIKGGTLFHKSTINLIGGKGFNIHYLWFCYLYIYWYP